MIRLTLAALLLSTAAAAENVDGRRFVIVDGNTVAYRREKIRIENIDAPESFRSRCERELVAGLRAKERLAALLRSGPVVITRMGEDRYSKLSPAWLSVARI